MMRHFSDEFKYSIVGSHRLIGPNHTKGIRCGYCSALKEKDKRKIDSCPECGKSMYAYKKINRRF